MTVMKASGVALMTEYLRSDPCARGPEVPVRGSFKSDHESCPMYYDKTKLDSPFCAAFGRKGSDHVENAESPFAEHAISSLRAMSGRVTSDQIV